MHPPPRPNKPSAFQSSVGTVTGIVSVLVTFFLLPTLWMRTTDWIEAMAAIYRSDPGFVSLIALAWLVMLAVLIFSAVRALLSGLLAAFGVIILLLISHGRE